MIAADSSTLIAYIGNLGGADVDHLDEALASGDVVISPVVLSELLSDPKLPGHLADLVKRLPCFELGDGFWIRVGELRAQLIARKLRARLPDAMIAQSCIDHDVPLITRDADFRHFAKHGGLKLV
ncbi:MAG: hypothetical protein C0454_10555 [Parvibaculum sp.]|jgi:hypothetical protein|nr:hypothetical protein [Parvibaculum sp.]